MRVTVRKIQNLFWYVVIILIIFFLGRALVSNWQQVKNYPFTFNYTYLLISFVLLILGLVGMSLVWRKILYAMEKTSHIDVWSTMKIYVYAEFSRYIPGSVWSVLTRVLLGRPYGFSSQNLLAASLLDMGLSAAAVLILGVVFVFLSVGNFSSWAFILASGAGILGLIIMHPKIFYPLLNLVLKKIKRDVVSADHFLKYSQMLKVWLSYGVCYVLQAVGFFFFIMSVGTVSWNFLPGIMGAYLLSVGLGVVMIFLPSGLGIKEGTMALILKFYFFAGMAVFLSLLSRLWFTVAELILLSLVFLVYKIKKYAI